jgi:diguanylate cyclase (GGDEF)-like protein
VQAPRLPADDRARVLSLRRLALLDTAPEERFDRITRTARRLFGVDIALVSLVDADRQWFKSRQGLHVPETWREISFCGHAILDRTIFQVPDTSLDSRFADNPLVVDDPHIGFYAGCPITSPDGATIGALCLIDHEPRVLDRDDLSSLRDLATMVEREIAISQMAVDDELTGLANRRGFMMMASQALAFCERQEVGALIVCADVDGLKAVNDLYGHKVGDELLRHAASAMAEAFRGSDVVGRLGGDEFAAVLTSFAGPESWGAARLADAVESCNRGLSGKPYRLSMAVGTARYDPLHPDAPEDLLHQADVAMYLDKERRRRDRLFPASAP